MNPPIRIRITDPDPGIKQFSTGSCNKKIFNVSGRVKSLDSDPLYLYFISGFKVYFFPKYLKFKFIN